MSLAEFVRTNRVVVLSNGLRGGTIAGPPHVLNEICRALGFNHPCEKGRVGLTAPKMALCGLADAVGVAPNWRSMSDVELKQFSTGEP